MAKIKDQIREFEEKKKTLDDKSRNPENTFAAERENRGCCKIALRGIYAISEARKKPWKTGVCENNRESSQDFHPAYRNTNCVKYDLHINIK